MWSVIGRVRARVTSAGLAALVAVAGLLASLVVGSGLAVGQRDAAAAQLDRRATLVAEAVANEAGRYVDTLRTVAAAAGAFEPLTATRFADVAQPLSDMGLAGAATIAYLVPAGDDEIAATQQVWRDRGAPGLRLTPAGGSGEHMFSIFSVPLDGVSPTRTGVDASQVAAPAQALAEARRSGHVTMSDAYYFLIDQHLPAGQQQMSFCLAAPVYGPSDAPGRREFRGWVVLGLRGHDFVRTALHRVAQNLIDVTLKAQSVDGGMAPVATVRAPVRGERDLSREVAVSVADRRWVLQVRAVGTRLPGGTTGLPTVVVSAGALLGLLLAGLVYILATGRARARAQVRKATVELAGAEAEARRQADLLTAILDSISDGVGVVDERGEFLLHNPAARAMLGLVEDRGGADNWQDHYGIYRPDGVTPFPTGELPLVRALAGESTEQVEMVIRNAGQPDGITITVSGRPLSDRAAQAGAVAVFHDITDRKAAETNLADTIDVLREREADLMAFAGVAAHDLKAPLSVVAGFAELLDDDLRTGADPATLRPVLDRIRTGVERMRRLIDDLLAYATARDGQLHPAPVDLQALVAEVVTERTAGLRTGPAAAGQPPLFPDVYTGPLPVVLADRSMSRQLLDNLVDNALKYAVPGQPARIDISAHHNEDGWVRVEIADRGTGIPAADQPHVFDSFRRSARHAGYAGTGLGLAICKRVVDRHGGTIHLTDNPGGGTKVLFTLPVAPASEPAAPAAAVPVG